MYLCPFQLTRERGKREPDVVLLTEISFWLIGKENISIVKNKGGGVVLRHWKPSPPKKFRIRTKILCYGKSSMDIYLSNAIPWWQCIRKKRENVGITSVGTVSHK